ncbi:MAG: hypothetical protein ACRESS_08840 [Stenotrophobium sp.]
MDSNLLNSRYPRLARLYGIDLRSLALFRFLLGAALLLTLCRDLAGLGAFYSDGGVMPRAWIIGSDSSQRLSLYFLNGSCSFAAALLLLQCVFALMLMLGWRTRLAGIASFVLWGSLLNRNPLILSGGDTLIACLLFWILFVPAAARYSVDAALSRATPRAEDSQLSWGALGLLLQIVAVCFFSALAPAGMLWHRDLLGLHDLLSLQTDTTALGNWLLNFPLALKAGSALIWWLALLAPLLAFAPIFTRQLRFAAVLIFATLNLCLLLCLNLGNTPWIGLIAWTPFLGGWLWDALAARALRHHPGTLRIYHDHDCIFCVNACRILQQFLILPRAQIAAAQDTPRANSLLQANRSWVVIDGDDQAHMKWPALVVLVKHSPLLGWLWPLLRNNVWVVPGNAVYDWIGRHRARPGVHPQTREISFEISRFWQRVAALSVVLLLCWNLAALDALPTAVRRVLDPAMRMLRLDQSWNIFAPYPFRDDGWFVIPAQLADSTELDLLHPRRGVPDYSTSAATPGADGTRWHLYLRHLSEASRSGDREQYAQYLCREWNRHQPVNAPHRLLAFKLIYMLRRTPPPGTPTHVEQLVLSRHDCVPADGELSLPAD